MYNLSCPSYFHLLIRTLTAAQMPRTYSANSVVYHYFKIQKQNTRNKYWTFLSGQKCVFDYINTHAQFALSKLFVHYAASLKHSLKQHSLFKRDSNVNSVRNFIQQPESKSSIIQSGDVCCFLFSFVCQ